MINQQLLVQRSQVECCKGCELVAEDHLTGLPVNPPPKEKGRPVWVAYRAHLHITQEMAGVHLHNSVIWEPWRIHLVRVRWKCFPAYQQIKPRPPVDREEFDSQLELHDLQIDPSELWKRDKGDYRSPAASGWLTCQSQVQVAVPKEKSKCGQHYHGSTTEATKAS
jgi:hypothetical protein